MAYCPLDDDPSFQADLSALNAHLKDSLISRGLDPVINGNVCHATADEFQAGVLSPRMATKRHALATLAKQSKRFLEVGVAGGHGMLVALHANPELHCVGIDLAEHQNPDWPRGDIFVPAAVEWFNARFGGRVSFRIGSAIPEMQDLAKTGGASFDLIHLDAGKAERLAEIAAIWPAVRPGAFLIQGDALNGLVRASSATLIADGRGQSVDPNAHGFTAQRIFQVLSLKPSTDVAINDVDAMTGKTVLLCVCHQDDETLFAGHLLNRLKGRANIHIASFFRPKANRPDTGTRMASLDRVAKHIGAGVTQLPFAAEQENVRLRRMVPLASDPDTLRARQTRPMTVHPLYPVLSAAFTGLVRTHQPDIVITHNHLGEYGHREHVFLNAVITAASKRLNIPSLLVFANGLEGHDFEVTGPTEDKELLYDHYRPAWNGPAMYDFAFAPEGFVNVTS